MDLPGQGMPDLAMEHGLQAVLVLTIADLQPLALGTRPISSVFFTLGHAWAAEVPC